MDQITRQPTCRQIASWTTEWMEGSLDTQDEVQFEAHLERCEDCSRFVSQMGTTVELTGLWGSVDASDSELPNRILEMLMASGSDEQAQKPPGPLTQPEEPSTESASPSPTETSCPELDASTARAYLEDRLPAREQIAVLEHLIDGCESCRLACVEIAFPELAGEIPEKISMREEPPSPELEGRYQEELNRLVHLLRGHRKPRTSHELDLGAFFLWLIRQGRDLTESEPSKSKEVASICSTLAHQLDAESQVRAAMLEGVVLRKVDGDFTEAERMFAWAQRRTKKSPKLAHLAPKVISLRAFLKWSRAQPNHALDLYQDALRMYRQRGDIARWGECSIDMVAPLQELEPEKAIRTLLKSSCVVDWSGRARLAMVLSQYLSYCYLGVDQPRRALVALEECRKHLARFDAGRSVVLRVDWTEASILNALGDYQEGAQRLRSIREEFLRLDLPASAAFVSLDLAISLIGVGRWRELVEVAEPLAAFLLSRGLSGEAAVTVGLFRRAVAAQAATIAQVQALRRRLG